MNSQDEPAIQIALQQMVVKLLGTIFAAGGLQVAEKPTAAIAVGIVGVVMTLLSLAQGYLTRAKVYAPATVEAMAPGVTGEPVLDVPFNR